ncbi:MAG: ATP phosphoribosyltransferase regulatory subunit [Oscillospiraceae bacterium]|nr:ATP phosphoribosyltransferase regulatory subunit [Oscillospiraceae bacterium]
MSMEQLAVTLSGLYGGYGYSHYTMSKFEEYELYLRNKDFLLSDRVLTFTDTDGKLMALKPDVTLSIIKNTDDSDGGVHKLYYRENVYRPGKSDQGFREIMQVGLECMGAVDSYCILEVLLLAVKSLGAISNSCVLDISHMGLLSGLLDKCGLSGAARDAALQAIGSKNTHELRRTCEAAGAPWQELTQLTMLSGSIRAVMPQLEEIFKDNPEFVSFRQLLSALDAMGVDCVNVDFSVVNDMRYYNGIVFRGFVEGIPEGVLSGGQYDGLMARMNRRGKAIGFALYPDLLERLITREQTADVDAVLLYDENADLCAVANAMENLTKQGVTVSAQTVVRKTEFRGQIYQLAGNEVKRLG